MFVTSKVAIAGSLAAALMVPSAAVNATETASDVIRHCVSLADTSERLACFDAAVRLADAIEGQAPATAYRPSPAMSAPIGDLAVANDATFNLNNASAGPDLSGFYFGASLGGETSLGYYTYSNNPDHHAYFESGRGKVFVGANMMSDDNLFGVEASLGRDLSAQTIRVISDTNQWNFPYQLESGSGGPQPFPPGTIVIGQRETYLQSGTTIYTNTFQELATPLLNARVGRQLGRFLLYGKAGAGVSLLEARTIGDATAMATCTLIETETTYGPDGYQTLGTSCLNSQQGQVTSYSEFGVAPTAALALGGEYHWDNGLFGRIEADMRHIFTTPDFRLDDADGLTQYGLELGVGKLF